MNEPINESQVLLEFAEPLLQIADVRGDARRMQLILSLAKSTWNLAVMESLQGGERASANSVQQARAIFAQAAKLMLRMNKVEPLVSLFDQLIDRKRRDFGQHQWLITEAKAVQNPDGRLEVEIQSSRPAGDCVQ